MIYIYGLIDPFTKEIRYIGKSLRPEERLTNHCNDQSVTWRTNWIRSVLQKGKRPELFILESLEDNEDWQESEKWWIKKGKKLGWRLTNCTDGGDGLVNPPDEVKQKMIKTWTGRKHSEKTKKLISEKLTGRIHTEEYKEFMRNTMTGRKITWRDKLSKANNKLTDDQVTEIIALLQDGTSQYVISDMFNIDQGTVSNIKRYKTYKHISRDIDKKSNTKISKSLNKLTDDQVYEILSLLDKKISHIVIGDMYNVCKSVISNIKLGNTYKHIPR